MARLTWVYLFARDDSGLEPDAGKYVQYTFSLNGIDYKTEYDLWPSCGGFDATCNPTMTEDSTIAGASYTRHLWRWMTDTQDYRWRCHWSRHPRRASVASAQSRGRHDHLFHCRRRIHRQHRWPGTRHRSTLGANSGPLTQRDHLFYDHREDIVTQLACTPRSGHHGPHGL